MTRSVVALAVWRRRKPPCPSVSDGSHSVQNHNVGHSGDPRMHLAINVVHLLATAGAIIETAREIVEWLHLY